MTRLDAQRACLALRCAVIGALAIVGSLILWAGGGW